MTHSEVRREQAYVEHAYERLEEMKKSAARRAERAAREQQSTFAGRLERDVLVDTGLRRLAELEFGDEPLVFGRLDIDDPDTLYVGRVGVHDADYTALVVDWRAPAAEPFYRATPGDPMGVVRRRHLLCRGAAVLGVSDELLQAAADREDLVLVGEAALLQALERTRTGRMSDIVATIQAEQDEVIRAPMKGVLVVQGGPGTGKTAVALHRAAYLLYAHRRKLEADGVLVVGPNAVFLRYIERVLPSLGERSVVMRTLGELLPGVEVTYEDPPAAAAVKGDARMVEVIASAVMRFERPLSEPLRLAYDGEGFTVTPKAAAKVVERARAAEGPHNGKRALVSKLLLRAAYEAWRRSSGRSGDRDHFDEVILSDARMRSAFEEIWPLLSPQTVVRSLYSDPDGVSGGVLTAAEREALRSSRASWTVADVALLDEASVLVGTARRPEAQAPDADDEERWMIERMIEDLGSVDPDTDVVAAPLIRSEREFFLRRYLDARAELDTPDDDAERTTYGHVVVDEAQDLTPMQWRMVARRCAGRSMTITGDLGQAGGPWIPASWEEVAAHIGGLTLRVAELTINYRTPVEVMDLAAGLLAEAAPGLEPPRSVRSTGQPPTFRRTTPDRLLEAVLEEADAARARVPDGTVAVIAVERVASELRSRLGLGETPDLQAPLAVLTPRQAKGLEFDAVVVVEPTAIAAEAGLRTLYVACTRPTQHLGIVHAAALPSALAR